MGLPLEVEEAQEKIIGAWEDAEGKSFFMFTDPEKNWDKSVMTFKINGLLRSIPYFITILPTKKFIIHPVIPIPPFQYGNLLLEFIGDDMIEIRYYDDYIFTLMKMSGDFEKVFTD